MAGLLVGYELFGGLYADVKGQWWFGNSPSISKLAPGLTWYTPIPLLRPYIGAYYAPWFVGGDNSDQDAIGGRAGVTLLSPGRTMLTAGVSYEQAVSCSHNLQFLGAGGRLWCEVLTRARHPK